MIVLGVLLLLFSFGTFSNALTRLYFLEKEVEVIDLTEVRDDSDHPGMITGYKPVVKFEVAGKFYQGTAHVNPLWKNGRYKSMTILYNPQNPAEFQPKESSKSPVKGCIFAIIILIALAVTVYFYLRSR